MSDDVKREISLDPEDWEALGLLGHRMVDDMMAYLRTVRDRPVWQPPPEPVKEALDGPMPQHGQPAEAVYDEFLRHILPYPEGNIHPRFWGWVIGTGTPFGMLAEMLAAGMNPNVGSANQVAAYVETQVLDWLKQMLGVPPRASGLLLSGGSMANLVALAVARTAKAGFNITSDGLAAGPRLTLYASSETHTSVQKAVQLLGLGNRALHRIPVDHRFEIDVTALGQAIQRDRAAGDRPIAVIGNAGTVNTGAIDDLDALASMCASEGLWFHVDGAFGALAALCPSMRPRLKGMERADSIAFDLHKWMYMPYDVGCVLVRHPDEHLRTFSVTSGYLARTAGGLAAAGSWFSDYGPELSRGFRALKVWMSLKEHGVEKYAAMIRQNIDQAGYLASLIAASRDLELLAPVPLNIVCFRFHDERLEPAALDALNEQILVRLQESGVAAPSFTRIRGAFAIRVAICNHRSRREDFELLVDEVVRLGTSMLREQRA